MADTSTATPVFLIQKPDYGREIVTRLVFRTSITTADDRSEQRGKRRQEPLIGAEFQIPNAKTAVWTPVRMSLMRALSAVAVVPVWSHWLELSGAPSADSASFSGQSVVRRKFRVGDWALIEEDGLDLHFRQVASVTDSLLTLEANGGQAAYPDIASPAFTAAARIYPAIRAIVNEGRVSVNAGAVDVASMAVIVNEL